MNNIIGSIILFMIFATVGIFVIVLIQDGLSPVILDEFKNASSSVLTNQTQINKVQEIRDGYDDAKIDYDTIFLVIFLTIHVTAFTLAIISPKLPNLEFITFLFLGTLLLIFIIPIFIQINNYFYKELILDLFSGTTFQMPLYNYANSHQLQIIIIDVIILLGINRLFGRNVYNNPILDNGDYE